MDGKSQSAQLRKFAIEVERDHIVDCCEYAEAAERIEKLERALAEARRINDELRNGLHPNYYHCDKCGFDYVSTHHCVPNGAIAAATGE